MDGFTMAGGPQLSGGLDCVCRLGFLQQRGRVRPRLPIRNVRDYASGASKRAAAADERLGRTELTNSR